MWSNTFFIGLLFCIGGLTSCAEQQENTSALVAQFGESKLYVEDLIELFGEDVKTSDLGVKIYVHNWIRNEVVLQNGSKELLPDEKDFSKELKQYENSLLRYKIESKYIDEHVDTSVSTKDMKVYYELNSSNFELKENYVKVRILKMKGGFSEVKKRKKMISYKDSAGKENYNLWVEKHHLFSIVYDSSWVKWDHMKEIVPIKPYSDEYFLTNNSYRELWADGDLWVIKLVEYQLKDNKSPFEMVESRIKSILINKRKIGLVKKMEKELYNSAIKSGKIKLYINEN
ncbi:MAG: hypothetical protein ACJA0Q_000160 [Saprospiraceae bacterium]|jgi:hypothetical protein